MKKPHLVILGAGISGLALAWFLERALPHVAITLVEKNSQVGGWIQSNWNGDFLFEKGPCGCRTAGKGLETLNLIHQLGLEKEVIALNPYAKKRYLWTQKRLQKLPTYPWEMISSPLIRGSLLDLLKESFRPSSPHEDESVDSFCRRRLGATFTEQLIFPLITGIYAGDPKELSMKSCFPLLHDYEKKHGSILKGFLKREKKDKSSFSEAWKLKKHLNAPMFSFKSGMATLPNALATQLKTNILLDAPVKWIHLENGKLQVKLNDRSLEADHLFSTLPLWQLSPLLDLDSKSPSLFQEELATLDIVSIGYHKKLLPREGIGYLVPLAEKEEILGMLWSSNMFPQQNHHDNQTRLNVLIGGVQQKSLLKELTHSKGYALRALQRHLGITASPDVIEVHRAFKAIPQYRVGHAEQLRKIKSHFQNYPMTLLGTSYYGVGVNDCIAKAREVAEIFAQGRI